MKIEKTSKPVAVQPVATEGQPRANTAKPATGTASSKVHLGETATQIRSMEASMASAPVMDAAKVAEIKEAISAGRFQVNTGVVADRLIETVQDLIISQKK